MEVRIAKKTMVCNRIYCGKIIEKGEKYYWTKLMRRSYCMAHEPSKGEDDART
jgi:hypothetical protein